MKPRPASQRAMAAKPTQRQLRAAFDAQSPVQEHGIYVAAGFEKPKLKPKRRKIDGKDTIDDLGEK